MSESVEAGGSAARGADAEDVAPEGERPPAPLAHGIAVGRRSGGDHEVVAADALDGRGERVQQAAVVAGREGAEFGVGSDQTRDHPTD